MNNILIKCMFLVLVIIILGLGYMLFEEKTHSENRVLPGDMHGAGDYGEHTDHDGHNHEGHNHSEEEHEYDDHWDYQYIIDHQQAEALHDHGNDTPNLQKLHDQHNH